MGMLSGCSPFKYESYDSKDPMIGITTEYISGWKHDEMRGAKRSFAQALFFPQNEKKPQALMAVTVTESAQAGYAQPTLEAAEKDLLARRMKMKEARVLSRSRMKVLDEEAAVVELTYLLPEDLLNPRSQLIRIKEKVVIFKKNHNFYSLRYQNSARDFDRYARAFRHLVRKTRIKG